MSQKNINTIGWRELGISYKSKKKGVFLSDTLVDRFVVFVNEWNIEKKAAAQS